MSNNRERIIAIVVLIVWTGLVTGGYFLIKSMRDKDVDTTVKSSTAVTSDTSVSSSSIVDAFIGITISSSTPTNSTVSSPHITVTATTAAVTQNTTTTPAAVTQNTTTTPAAVTQNTTTTPATTAITTATTKPTATSTANAGSEDFPVVEVTTNSSNIYGPPPVVTANLVEEMGEPATNYFN